MEKPKAWMYDWFTFRDTMTRDNKMVAKNNTLVRLFNSKSIRPIYEIEKVKLSYAKKTAK
jgi:hypothetical protein